MELYNFQSSSSFNITYSLYAYKSFPGFKNLKADVPHLQNTLDFPPHGNHHFTGPHCLFVLPLFTPAYPPSDADSTSLNLSSQTWSRGINGYNCNRRQWPYFPMFLFLNYKSIDVLSQWFLHKMTFIIRVKGWIITTSSKQEMSS